MVIFGGFWPFSQKVFNVWPWNLVYRHIVDTFRCVCKMVPGVHIFGPLLAPQKSKIRSKVSCWPILQNVSTGITWKLIFKLIGTTLRSMKNMGPQGPYFRGLFGPWIGRNGAFWRFLAIFSKSFQCVTLKFGLQAHCGYFQVCVQNGPWGPYFRAPFGPPKVQN